MYSTNEWFYFTTGMDKKTCDKIRNSAKGNWEKSQVDTKEGITEAERTTGVKPILNVHTKSRISDVAWT